MERKENVLIIEEQIENLCRNREYVFIHLRVYVSASFRLQISDTIVKLVNNETQCRYLIVLQTSNTLCLGLLIHFSSTVLALPFSYFACLRLVSLMFKMVPVVTVASFHIQQIRDTSFSLVSLKAKKELSQKSSAAISLLPYWLKFNHMLILESIIGLLILISPPLGSHFFNHQCCMRKRQIPEQK